MTSRSPSQTRWAWDRHFTDNANKHQIARLNRITNDFYKHHEFYRILGVERHTAFKDIAERGESLMSVLVPGSEQYEKIKKATKCLTDETLRKFYNDEGDGNMKTEDGYASESQREYWAYMRKPENQLRHGDVTYSKKELAIFASMKHGHGAASGKLSTHNQFGSASTWNPYFI